MTCPALTHGPHNPECTCPLVAEDMDSAALARFEMAMLGYVAVKWISREEVLDMYPPRDPIVGEYGECVIVNDERPPKPINPPTSRFIPSKKPQPWRRRQ